MKIAGLTIAKNCNRFKYPIAEVIEQHKDLFDLHIIGVPKSEQDTDDTCSLIYRTCATLNIPCQYLDSQEYLPTYGIALIELDWPNKDVAWSEESLDKKLQQKIIDKICWDEIDWIVKIDADEFYNKEGIDILKEMMEAFKDTDLNAIGHNYLQFMGSLNYTVYDPTDRVCHIFKPGKAKFCGNDAMQFKAEGETLYLDDVFLHHIGYVKDPMLITTRIREHLVLNESMYPNAVHNAEKWVDYKFEFPKHKVGAKLWPIAISDAPNETEYTIYPEEKLPSVLRRKKDEFNFHIPKT